MARFHGNIGYTTSVETAPGVWTDAVNEREYYGDVIREARRWVGQDQVNDNLSIDNRISIVADDFAYSNFSTMKYVIWAGIPWKISSIEVQRPRLILSLGGVYHGNTA